ncbi:MAG: DUF4340 domain-containing protein [Planctomycetota bacterium]|jgi:hypothetical protein
MNTNAILGIGVVAVIVTIASLYALLSPTTGGAPKALLDISPSSIVGMDVHPSTDRVEHLVRTDAGWVYQRDEISLGWPINSNNINGALRVLADLHAPVNRGASSDADGPRVVLTLSDASTRTIQFGSTRVGGSVAMRVSDGPSAFVDDSIRAMFVEPGPSAWRATQAIPGVDVNISRLSLTLGNESLALGRINNSWQLIEPVAHRADQQRVGELIHSLISLNVREFLDATPDASPLVPDIVVEVSRRASVTTGSGTPEPARQSQTLLIDSTAPDSPRSHNLTHDTHMALDGASVDKLRAFTILALLDSTACGSLHVDVAGIDLDSPASYWSYRRSIDGWHPQNDAPHIDGSTIDMLIGFLTDAPSGSIRVAPMPELVSWADVTLLDLAQEPLETITLGIDPEGVLHAAIQTLDDQIVVLSYDQTPPSMLGRFFSQ